MECEIQNVEFNQKKLNELLKEYLEIRRKIALILQKINCIVWFTPFGCAQMLCETFSYKFFNSHFMSIAFRSIYKNVDGNAQWCFEKLSLASAVDAFYRKRKKFLEMQEQIAIAEKILEEIKKLDTQKVHCGGRFNRHGCYRSSLHSSQNFFCQFCDNHFSSSSTLKKHIQRIHSMDFENSIAKHYAIANQLSSPNVQEALLCMKSQVIGLEQFEILLDPILLKTLNMHIRRIELNEHISRPHNFAQSTPKSPNLILQPSLDCNLNLKQFQLATFVGPKKQQKITHFFQKIDNCPTNNNKIPKLNNQQQSPLQPQFLDLLMNESSIQETQDHLVSSGAMQIVDDKHNANTNKRNISRLDSQVPPNYGSVMLNSPHGSGQLASQISPTQRTIQHPFPQNIPLNMANSNRSCNNFANCIPSSWLSSFNTAQVSPSIGPPLQGFRPQQRKHGNQIYPQPVVGARFSTGFSLHDQSSPSVTWNNNLPNRNTYLQAHHQQQQPQQQQLNTTCNYNETNQQIIIQQQQQGTVRLARGDNKKINNFLRNSREQASYPYYLIDDNGNIHCHCVGNPIAFHVTERNYLMCSKRTRKAGKCCLYIPTNLM